jgi:hypothetical protein
MIILPTRVSIWALLLELRNRFVTILQQMPEALTIAPTSRIAIASCGEQVLCASVLT